MQTTFDHARELWIEPEILRRRQASLLPDNFKIARCLIKFPKEQGHQPIVEFNDEIKWLAHMQLVPGTTLHPGQTIYLHDVQRIAAVNLPEINGERVAFVYFFFDGIGYQMTFDFTPNVSDEVLSKDEKEKGALSLSISIAESLQANLIEKTIHIHNKEKLRDIGLWVAPALLPYPLSKIIKQLEENDIQGARGTLVEHCTPQQLERLSSKWWNVEQFNSRKKVIVEALESHTIGKYISSIYILVPQIEGIITDRIYETLPEGDICRYTETSKIKQFQSLEISKEPLRTYTYKKITDSAIEFMLGDMVIGDFRWKDEIDKTFPNRHVVAHGNYQEELFSEENSIKLFLLLDTIYHIIAMRSDTS